mgnify:FL=1|jgi:hypothetical protein
MKIFSPVKDYTGVSASVPFCDGAGETDDPHLIEWFKDHGYIAEETDAVTVDVACLGEQVEAETVEQVVAPKTKHTRK